MWTDRLCRLLGFEIPFQRLRISLGETGPTAKAVPGFLRAGTFGARQNADGSIRISGGWRVPGVAHDLSTDDLRHIRLWLPEFYRRRRDVRLSIDPTLIWHDLAYLACGTASRLFPRGYEPRIVKEDVLNRLRALVAVVPELDGIRIHRWFGAALEITPDLEPVIGWLPDTNAYVVSGFSGHGFILGPVAAGAAAAAVTDGVGPDVDLSAYRPERFAEAGFTPRRGALF
jgi:glycine/D-amino acid oxidase-like deaminating enzyme